MFKWNNGPEFTIEFWIVSLVHLRRSNSEEMALIVECLFQTFLMDCRFIRFLISSQTIPKVS